MPGFNIGDDSDGPSNIVEPLRSHRWRIKKLGPIDLDGVRIFAKDLSLPTVDIEVDEVQGATIKYKFASVVNFSEAVLTFYDTNDLLISLQDWLDLVYVSVGGEGTGELGLADDYKDEASFELVDNEGFTEIEYRLLGAFPTKIDNSQLTYTNSNIKEITMTLQFDNLTTL